LGRSTETVALITATALFLVLLYVILPVLSPFLLVGAILFLLNPLRRHIFVRRIMWLCAIFFVIWFFNSLVGALTPFIIAFLIAYLLNPLVSILERRRIRRWMSSLAILLLLLLAIVSLFVILVPVIVSQFRGIIGNITNFISDTAALVKDGTIIEQLARYGVPVERLRQFLSEELPPRLEGLLTSVLEGAFGLFTGVTGVISQAVDMLIVPFVAFYLVKDYPLVIEKIESLIPAGSRKSTGIYFRRVNEVLGDYVRGVLLVALIQGAGVAVGLLILGVQDALVLGLMSGLLNLIPFVGFYFSLLVSVIVALLSGDPVLIKVLGVIGLYIGLSVFESTVLGPKIVGERVGLHPVLLILALVVFGYFFGFVGLLIAVPLTAVLLMSVKIWQEKNATALPSSASE
jgi:predicted PurR-regulated permease PerM